MNIITFKEPSPLKEYVEALHLNGKTIKRFIFDGFCYNFQRWVVEDVAYRTLVDKPEEERQLLSELENIPDDIMFNRAIEIDEPLIVEFDDGTFFYVDIIAESFYKVASIGRNPEKRRSSPPNIDVNVVLAPCLKQTIKTVEVHSYKTKEHQMYGDFEDGLEHELIDSIILVLENDLRLVFTACIDYGEIFCGNSAFYIEDMPYSEIKTTLKSED